MIRRHLLISGRVQGVGFRWHCHRAATSVGVTGWAHNLSDGRVEVVLEGPADAVARAEAECRTGPRHGRVRSVDGTNQEPTGLTGFGLA